MYVGVWKNTLLKSHLTSNCNMFVMKTSSLKSSSGRQRKNFSLEQKEAGPLWIKVEKEELQIGQIEVEEEEAGPPLIKVPELLQIKEEAEELEPPEIKNEEEIFTFEDTKQDTDMFLQTGTAERIVQTHSKPDCEELHLGGSQRNAGVGLNNVGQEVQGTNCCEICRKHFRDRCSLINHGEIHTGEKLYSCETCGNFFRQPSNLAIHMRTHTHDKPYSCKTCGKTFGYKSYFSEHMRTHTLAKVYSCKTCDKSFTRNCGLTDHMKTHVGERPYSCETCGKCFRHLSNLGIHMRTHTGEKSRD